MPLSEDDKKYIVDATVDLLRHKKRARLLEILERRLESGDYPDDRELSLDEIVFALAKAVDEKLDESD